MPLSSSVTRRAFLAALSGVTAAAVLGGANSPAVAQQSNPPYTAEQCRNAKIIITDVYTGYLNRGGLSRDFTNGVNAWTKAGCQGPIRTVAMLDNDEEAFALIRLRLVALRMSTAQPAALNR